MVLIVDPYPNGHAQQPMVWQGLGPQGIDFKNRSLDRWALSLNLIHWSSQAKKCECQETEPYNAAGRSNRKPVHCCLLELFY
jgi:hypothetical protein